MDFRPVEFNLRESFRVLAEGRARGDVRELPGVSIASLGVKFRMFNAAFLNAPVQSAAELEERLRNAATHFQSLGIRWSLWVCEDWLAAPVRRKLSPLCARAGLKLASEMPGMTARTLRAPEAPLPELEYRPVDSDQTLADFRGLGSVCFHVPHEWFTEVFDSATPQARPRFRCWVGYLRGQPVATAASVLTGGTVGLYNVGTAPGHRRKGFAEAITRHTLAEAGDAERFVLQSTTGGYRLYERLGFRTVTRILAYSSEP